MPRSPGSRLFRLVMPASVSSSTRICVEPDQILPCPFPGHVTSRCLDRHPQWLGKAFSGQDPGNQPGMSGPPITGMRISETSPEHRGTYLASCHATVTLCLFRLRPLSTHLSRNFARRSDSTSKVIPLDVHEVLEALHFWADPWKVAARGSPTGLPFFTSEANLDHGCFQSWLGGSLGCETQCGNLHSGRVSEQCQYTWDTGSSQGIVLAREPSTQSSPGSDGQYHHPILPEQEGGGQDPTLWTS